MPDKWVTISEAVGILGISDRTIRRRIETGKIESKVEDKTRLVNVGKMTGNLAEQESASSFEVIALQNEVAGLKADKSRLQEQLDKLQNELSEAGRRSEQQNMITLQLTRQFEQSQLLLEYKSEPWWRRYFKRKGEKHV